MTDLLLDGIPAQSRDTDERYTPSWVFEALGVRFDLDPCSPVDYPSHVPADRRYTRLDDGLTAPWHGRVFVNPPYSNPRPWVERFITHGNGIWLGMWSNSTWLLDLVDGSDALAVLRDLAFVHPEHNGRRVNWPIMLAAVGDPDNVAALHRFAAVHRTAVLVRAEA